MAGIDAGRLLGSQVQGGAGVQGAAGAASGLPYLLALLGGAIAPEDSPFKQLGAVVASAAQDQLTNSYLERRRIDPNAPAPVGLTSNNRRLADQQVNQENQQKNVLSLQQRELDLKDQQIKQQKEIADSTFAQRSAEIFSQSQAAAASNQTDQDRNKILRDHYEAARNDKDMTPEKWLLFALEASKTRYDEDGNLDLFVDNIFQIAMKESGHQTSSPQVLQALEAITSNRGKQPQNQQPANTTGSSADTKPKRTNTDLILKSAELFDNFMTPKPEGPRVPTIDHYQPGMAYLSKEDLEDLDNPPKRTKGTSLIRNRDGLPIANQAVGIGYNILRSLFFPETSPEQQFESNLDAVQNRRLNPTDPDFGNLLTPGTTARKPTKVLSPIR